MKTAADRSSRIIIAFYWALAVHGHKLLRWQHLWSFRVRSRPVAPVHRCTGANPYGQTGVDPKPPNSRRAIRLWHSCVDVYISNPQATVVARSDHHGPGRKPGRAVAETHAGARGASADRVRGR